MVRTRVAAAFVAVVVLTAGLTELPGLSATLGLGLVGVVVVLIGLAIFVRRRRSSRRGSVTGRRPERAPPRRPERAPPPGPGTRELEAQASHALVETDDAVRTSEQELGFAAARYGERAAAPFSDALKSARAEIEAAFRLSQLLDDDNPQDDATRRSHLTEISAHCAGASRVLDEHSDAFDRLQDLEARSPELLAEVDTHAAQQATRVSLSRQVLEHLAARYTPQAIGRVAANPDHATGRLDFAAASVAAARRELAAAQTRKAAVLLQAAEAAADQATDLLNAVEHLEAALTQAASALPAALRKVDADVADASALPAGQSGDERTSLATRANAVAAEVRAQQAAGRLDTLAALRDVQLADAALDHALAGARAGRDRDERARAVLDHAMLVARSSVTAARDFITTRRGGVGARARTRLAEAQRHFRQAIGHSGDDPEAAVTEAQHADVLARHAVTTADQDISRFDHRQAPAAHGSGGLGSSLGGAFLGGVLIDCTYAGRDLGERDLGEQGPGEQGPGEQETDGPICLASFGGTETRRRRSLDAASKPRPDSVAGSEQSGGGSPAESQLLGPITQPLR